MSTPIITDELIETLKGIKDGREWEFQIPCGEWVKAHPNANIWVALLNGYPIRLKPFVPTPPEGYRLLTEEEKDGRWANKVLCWEPVIKQWVDGHWRANTDAIHYAVPIAPPKWFPDKDDWYQCRQPEKEWSQPQTGMSRSMAEQQALYYQYEYRECDKPAMVPLGPEDVPPGSVLRCLTHQPTVVFWSIKRVTQRGVTIDRDEHTWRELQIDFQILRPGSQWKKCEKQSELPCPSTTTTP